MDDIDKKFEETNWDIYFDPKYNKTIDVKFVLKWGRPCLLFPDDSDMLVYMHTVSDNFLKEFAEVYKKNKEWKKSLKN